MNLNKYRSIPPDPFKGSPLHQWGSVHASRLGTYWTLPVVVPLNELSSLRAVNQNKHRVASIVQAIADEKQLPPIEIGVFKDGSAWIVDGNHRLLAARRLKQPSVDVVFTFVGS